MKRKSKGFLITLNQVERWEKLYSYLKSLKNLNYIIAAKEIAPKTGHEHIHCYTQFLVPTSLSMKKTEGAHIDICRGSPQQNKKYVEKDGNVILEEGKIRLSGGLTISEVMEMSKSQRNNLPFVYYDKVLKLNENEDINIKADEYYKEVTVYFIWGDSGIGKTKKAFGLVAGGIFHEAKYQNGFWIGVADDENCRSVIYDDFRDSHMKPSEFINFIDYNVHNMNIKGGFIKNRYRLIIITSVQNPEELYEKFTEENIEPKKQWMRRLTNIIHLE